VTGLLEWISGVVRGGAQPPESPASVPPAERRRVDLRKAINAVSDVVQNRPRPLRMFDQIHMKTGDMVLQSEMIADWADGKRLAFIGDGDAISVCVAHLRARDVLNFGPSHITVFDFDERTVEAVMNFADRERITNLDARLYNVLDAMETGELFDCFYTNPPWGASNNGESVNVFVERGMEATGHVGEGVSSSRSNAAPARAASAMFRARASRPRMTKRPTPSMAGGMPPTVVAATASSTSV
jgi:hypothetical protein